MDPGSQSYDKFLAGDDEGMAEIITMYQKGLYYYLLKIVSLPHLAEEITEDTFVHLCIKKPRNKKNSSFKTWLYTIAHNLAIDQLRRLSRAGVSSLEETDLPSDLFNPESKLLRDERGAAVNRLLQTLKIEHREVLWLLYFEDLSYAEISHIMHKSHHATQQLASRAKQALKEKLIQEGIDDENL